MSEISYLTQEGLDKLQAQLHQLQTVERPSISRQIAEARDKGDLSENAEYDAAKEAQGLLEMKISKLQNILASARVIDKSKITTDHIQLLNKVTIKNTNNGKEMTYTLVSESEADFKAGKIAINTPIGKGLLGKKIGDIVNITVPTGVIPFEILNIEL